MNKYLDIKDEVKQALKEGKPVVALESTIISHGMPYPKNVETALRVEQTIRENGAVPATIAIISGRLKVGLTAEDLEYFGKKGPAITKVSRRDIALVAARNQDGATTVAATMIIAAMAGIKVFATGGIGGVHRGAEKTMDISADLDEFVKTPMIVVCAGAKAILDLNLTMEYLETKGVPVFCYKTNELPAFYTKSSGISAPNRADSAKEIADAFNAQQSLGLGGGLLVANPIPDEYSMDPLRISGAIEQALDEMEKAGIHGKETTPYLLDKIQKLTDGDSLESNIMLVLNNAKLAAEIASSL